VAWHDSAQAVLKMAWWLWMAWFLVGFLRAFVIVERRPREGKLLQDLIAGLIYLAALFAIVSYVFDLPVQGLLATSGVIAIILGLALQSTLGDVFSGIVLSFSRPYRPGDWISIDGGTDGRVIEMNWRATHVLTARRDLAIVPNSTIAKSKIVNVSSPSGVHGNTVTLQVASGGAPPSFATEVIERALLNCRLILPEPAPVIATKAINRAYAEFEITFFIETLALSRQAQNEWYDLVYRHLASAAIDLASPESASTQISDAARPAQSQAERVVDWVEIFAPLTSAERTAIAGKLKRRTYDKGDRLLEPGTLALSMFIIGSGVLSFSRRNGDLDVEILRLGPGGHYGEIGVLTDKPSTATILALTPATLYELQKADLRRIIEARPEVAHELAGAIARRQAAGLTVGPAEAEDGVPPHRLTNWFTTRFQRLYDISNAA
jgi:small-conductance mechanosensitive channel